MPHSSESGSEQAIEYVVAEESCLQSSLDGVLCLRGKTYRCDHGSYERLLVESHQIQTLGHCLCRDRCRDGQHGK
jgi:hypothetical protein